MHSISRHLLYDDTFHELKISAPNGNASVFHVYLDNYYHGQILRQQGKLVGHMHEKSDLTAKDVQNIFDLIEGEGWLRPRPAPGPA